MSINKTIEYFLDNITVMENASEDFGNNVNQLRLLIETSETLEEKCKLLALAYKVKKLYEDAFVKQFFFLSALRKSVAETMSMICLNTGENPKIKIEPFTKEHNVTISCVTEGYASVTNFNDFVNYYSKQYSNTLNMNNVCWELCSNKDMLNVLVNDIISSTNEVEIPGLKISPVLNLRFYFSKD